MRPQVGQVINNKYRLLRLIGDGGMGSVYEARHEVLGTSVALKFLHPELSRRQGLVQRFLQEARVSAQIQSPHVVRVTDVDQTPSGAFIVMEYLEGRTLQALYEELYRAGRQLSYGDALEYAMQMLEGVEAAHKQGIVHRDLKPDNVIITVGPKGRQLLKLLDFGIAKLKASSEYSRGLTRPGVIMGTPEYMAPEQAFSADAVDARADIFSLGVMIFEMLAGRRPVGGDEPQQIATAYLSGRIAYLTDLAPSIAPELAAAVHRAMAATVTDRWQTVTDFRDALEPFAAAVNAPSALPAGPSLSNPGLVRMSKTPEPAPATPPATNVGGEASGVPRTVPPVDEPRVSGDRTNPADPPEMSASNPRGPTPLGGFAPAVPATKSASPYVPEGDVIDPAATAFASPLDLSPRPSGTAIGGAPALGPDAFGGPPAPLPAPVAATPKAKAKRKSGGVLSSLPGILLLAAGIAGAVVGGVYLAQKNAKADDRDEPHDPPPATSVRSDPPADPPNAPAAQTPAGRPTQPAPLVPRKPITPGKGPAPQPTPGTSPSSRPPILPSSLPLPIVIPSTLPFGLPFPQIRQQDQPPRGSSDEPRRQQRDPGFRRQQPDWDQPRQQPGRGSADPGYD
jgi:serine/threonine-protein kinase